MVATKKRKRHATLATDVIQHHIVAPLIRERCYTELRELARVSRQWRDAVDVRRVALDYNSYVRSLVDALAIRQLPSSDNLYKSWLTLRKNRQRNDTWLCISYSIRSCATYTVELIYDKRDGETIGDDIERYATIHYLGRHERPYKYSDGHLYVGVFTEVLRSELSALMYNLMVAVLGVNGTYRLCKRKVTA